MEQTLMAGQTLQGAGHDLVSAMAPAGWLVSGWFTPDYRPMAQRLADELTSYGAPYHFLSVDKTGTWDREVFRKPSMVQRAMRAHPNEVIMFMDVDCQIIGPIAGAVTAAADVSCYLNVKKRGRRQFGDMSSRVMVIRPTPGARAWIEAWEQACREETAESSDEPALMVALGRCAGATWSALDRRYAGREATATSGEASIVHESAHEQSNVFRRLNRRLKTLRRSVFGHGTTRPLTGKQDQRE